MDHARVRKSIPPNKKIIRHVRAIARQIEEHSQFGLPEQSSEIREIQRLYDEVARMKALLERMIFSANVTHYQNDCLIQGINDHLTEREVEVLDLLSRGMSYKEMSGILECKISTIQTHIKRIYKKLGVHSRAEACYEAGQMGLFPVTVSD